MACWRYKIGQCLAELVWDRGLIGDYKTEGGLLRALQFKPIYFVKECKLIFSPIVRRWTFIQVRHLFAACQVNMPFKILFFLPCVYFTKIIWNYILFMVTFLRLTPHLGLITAISILFYIRNKVRLLRLENRMIQKGVG